MRCVNLQGTFMWHYVRILCNYEVLFRNKYQGIFLSLRILVISA